MEELRRNRVRTHRLEEVLIWIGVTLVGSYSLKESVDSKQISTWMVNFVILVIAARTLQLTIPRPAKLEIERQHELNLSDLVFSVLEPTDQFPARPRDFLLQLHVAVCNVGGQKGVLSALRLEKLLSGTGEEVRPFQMPIPIGAHQAIVRKGWRDLRQYFEVDEISLPIVIEPNDVVTMRFRCRRGIDWSDGWDVGRIQELAMSLAQPVSKAEIVAIYRRGKKVVEERTVVPVNGVQQAYYAQQLSEITSAFTNRPSMPVLTFQLE